MSLVEVRDPLSRQVRVGDRYLVDWKYSNGFLSGILRPPGIIDTFTKVLNSRPCMTVSDTEVLSKITISLGFIPVPSQITRTTVVIGCNPLGGMSVAAALQPVNQGSGEFWSWSKIWAISQDETEDVEQIMIRNPSEFPAAETAQAAARETIETVGAGVGTATDVLASGVEQIVRNPLVTIALVAAVVWAVFNITR